MKSKSERLAKLLIQLLPDEGTYQLMALANAESNLQRKKEAALGVLNEMGEFPNKLQLNAWWTNLRGMLHAYLQLADVIEETCALLGPVAEGELGLDPLSVDRGKTDIIREKLKSGQVFWVDGTDDIN